MKIRIINGANLNMLARREQIYGTQTLQEINSEIEAYAKSKGANVSFFQSNCEGAIIDEIHKCYDCFDGLIINPGAYAHYSYAIMDALSCVSIPKIEVHLTDISKRESFRQTSVTSSACHGMISGGGVESYKQAIQRIIDMLQSQSKQDI